MPKSKGNDQRVYIDSATPGTFTQIAGQTGHTINRSAQQIDTTTKDDGNYGTSMPGNRALSLSLSVIPNLPDTLGLERLWTVANANPQVPVLFEVRRAPYATPGDIIFKCSMFVGDLGSASNLNQATESTITLLAAAAPTVDLAG
jgi:hypothetical protein